MTAPATNFLGIPIDGEIRRDSQVPQRPLSDLEPLIRAVLDDESIVDLGWTQYTPYYNDGEPCTFRIGAVWFRTAEDVAASEDDDEHDEDHYSLWDHPTLGRRPIVYHPHGGISELGTYEGPDEARYDRVKALDDAIDSGAFDHVLLDAFGDHARVTVRRTGITVEFYDHD